MKRNTSRQGFTLVEIMIVVAIIALLAAIAIPSAIRARKRSQATSSVNTLRVLDAAIEQWATENGMSSGSQPTGTDLAKYVKEGSNVYNQLTTTGTPLDAIGGPITVPVVGVVPQLPDQSFAVLSDVAPASFWGEYYTSTSGS